MLFFDVGNHYFKILKWIVIGALSYFGALVYFVHAGYALIADSKVENRNFEVVLTDVFDSGNRTYKALSKTRYVKGGFIYRLANYDGEVTLSVYYEDGGECATNEINKSYMFNVNGELIPFSTVCYESKVKHFTFKAVGHYRKIFHDIAFNSDSILINGMLFPTEDLEGSTKLSKAMNAKSKKERQGYLKCLGWYEKNLCQ